MGFGDMIDKGKEALKNITGNEQKSDELLDKAEGLANEKFAGHEDQVKKVRDTIDDKIGE